MASIELEKLFATCAEEEAEVITTAALASRQYRLEMKAIATVTFLATILFSFRIFLIINALSPAVYVRLLLWFVCLGSMLLAFKVIYPINDKLVDRAIRRELASRKHAGAP
ncbi:MAG: hypothetical protein EON58_21140 [Alphaproteobacteria bacterium]|nr:MAG: hypothetical protein EON58_21140 [Alphaproteobacteria bacterium]